MFALANPAFIVCSLSLYDFGRNQVLPIYVVCLRSDDLVHGLPIKSPQNLVSDVIRDGRQWKAFEDDYDGTREYGSAARAASNALMYPTE